MPRPASPLLWLATLSIGVVLGLVIGRGAVPLSAQAGAPKQALDTDEAARQASEGSEDAVYRELARQYERFRSIDQTFELVSKIVSPAVVHIVSKKSGPDESGRMTRFEETGSGVIVRSDRAPGCFVLTNNHVVEGSIADDISVYLHDGRVIRPDQFWADQKVDIAVLKFSRSDLPVARLGNSDEATVGTWVLAMGSPFGLTHSVSHGIISARGRYEEELEDDGVENQDFLQTDAAINPGNSGGPLVNLKGEVVGINTAIASNGGGSEGVGFSIPINLARWAMNQLVTNHRVSRGAIGVRLEELDPQSAIQLGLERPRGARIHLVQDGSPAALGGLRAGDVILKYNGINVIDYNHLINLVSMTPIGETAEVVVWRDRRAIPLKVTVADRGAIVSQPPAPAGRASPGGLLRRPPVPGPLPTPADLGLDLVVIDSASTARRYGLEESLRGVLVAKVDASSRLSPYLKPFDLIQAIDGQPVRSTSDVLQSIGKPGHRSPLELNLQRSIDGSFQDRTIRIP